MENQEKRCMGCMNLLSEDGGENCPICGYPINGENPKGYLPVGTPLSDRYISGRALSVSGDSTLYIGWDQSGAQPVFIREYMPTTLCRRTDDNLLEAQEGKEMAYEGLRQSFLQHARSLARSRELGVLMPVYDIFEQNGTAYTIGEYSSGMTLKNYMAKHDGRLSWEDARKLFMPFLTAVEAAHSAGIYHFGISPDTVVVGADGKLRLIGFSTEEAHKLGSGLDVHLNPGFAAPEQYIAHTKLTAATDVYGLGATLFWMLSGVTPPDGVHRDTDGQDLLMSEDVVNSLPEEVTAALVGALTPAAMDRLSTVEEFQCALNGGSPGDKIAAAGLPVRDENYLPKKFRWIFGIVIFLLLLVVILLGMTKCNGTGGTGEETDGTTTAPSVTLPSMSTNAPPAVGDDTRPAPNLLNKDFWALKNVPDNFKVELESMIFNTAAPGTILVQEPKPGEEALYASTIRVIVSAGPEEKAVPDVSGWTEELAAQYLTALGFKVDRIEINVSTVDKGKVDSTDPKYGKTAKHGETITLRISNVEQIAPPSSVVMPDTTGIPSDIAKKVLESLGLTVTINEVTTMNDLNVGLVRSTSVVSGTSLEVGTEVILNVYVAGTEDTDPTTSTTSTTSTTPTTSTEDETVVTGSEDWE